MRLGIVLLVASCGDNLSTDYLQGGADTVFDRSELAFTHPLASLTADQLERHNLGRGPFAFHWTAPQLGPQFNNDSCVACHGNNGRGLSQISHDVFGSQALIRVSQELGEPAVPGGQVPVPGFGLQLQDHATFGVPEVRIDLSFIDVEDHFDDGEVIMLREPRIAVSQPNGDPMPPGIHMSYRQAPPLIGMGLLDAIPAADILGRVDPDDADGDGISGRANISWDQQSQSSQLGRFGHKASVPRLIEQAAGAFANDMGLTNLIFTEPDGTRDVNDKQLADVGFHVTTLAVPAAAERDDEAERGRTLFDTFDCAGCHVPTQITSLDAEVPQLRGQTIHPYTDLLLHDMGDRLTDARQDFMASGVEWRTPALWGIGLAQVVTPAATFLHDGRARTFAEAIMWHGGEAAGARESFRTASRVDRDALTAFLGTL